MLLELAQELRENIVYYLPLTSAKYVSCLLRVNLSEKKRVQQIWDEIFNILDCLNPHSFDKKTNEVTFKDSNIIVNIDGQIRASESIAVAPTKIFSRRSESSATLVWGEAALRKISRKDVTGTKMKASLDTVSIGCYFDLSDKKLRWDQCFLARDSPRDFHFARLPRLGKHPVN
ncbi:hypothetical protein DL95DRAFT_471569 [Leptodontidium sp. 2 PMI_412]|nr:hypothetical protein DL95DRAFT_471569 [Leptodontidium sp. 2 PMI_412]